MKKIYWFKLLYCILGCALTASLAHLLGGGLGEYSALAPWMIYVIFAFGMVFMAIALYFIICTVVTDPLEIKLKKVAISLFLLAFVLIAAYPLFMVRLDNALAALILAASLFCVLAALMLISHRLNRLSSYFLLPNAAIILLLLYTGFTTM